jgi:hypothetical protein
MQAYKLKGKIDRSGKLIITEPTNLNPGEVEVIILQTATTTEKESSHDERMKKRPSKVKSFQDWFAKTEPISSKIEPDEAKWDYLKEKHNL